MSIFLMSEGQKRKALSRFPDRASCDPRNNKRTTNKTRGICHLQLNRRFCIKRRPNEPAFGLRFNCKKPLPPGMTRQRCDGGSVPAGGRRLAF